MKKSIVVYILILRINAIVFILMFWQQGSVEIVI